MKEREEKKIIIIRLDELLSPRSR